MDHASAHLMELSTEHVVTKVITSKFSHEVKENSLSHSENLMHNKEQQLQGDYYKQLGEAIKSFQDVLLFGPTDAKTELFNRLRADHNFDKIRIEVKSSDKMTGNQQHAFVREHFSRH